jgi:hypothetical protein
MSLHTLAKKAGVTTPIYSRPTNDNGLFTLNSGPRTLSYTGKHMINSAVRTPFKGIHPVNFRTNRMSTGGGHSMGGHSNHVDNGVIEAACDVRVNIHGNAPAVQPSSVSARAMVFNKYKWIKSGTFPNVWVQPGQQSSNEYTAKVRSKIASPSCAPPTDPKTNEACDCEKALKQKGIRVARNRIQELKLNNDGVAKSTHEPLYYDNYLNKVQNRCIDPTCSQKPFPYYTTNPGASLSSTIACGGVGAITTYMTAPGWYLCKGPWEDTELLRRFYYNASIINPIEITYNSITKNNVFDETTIRVAANTRGYMFKYPSQVSTGDFVMFTINITHFTGTPELVLARWRDEGRTQFVNDSKTPLDLANPQFQYGLGHMATEPLYYTLSIHLKQTDTVTLNSLTVNDSQMLPYVELPVMPSTPAQYYKGAIYILPIGGHPVNDKKYFNFYAGGSGPIYSLVSDVNDATPVFMNKLADNSSVITFNLTHAGVGSPTPYMIYKTTGEGTQESPAWIAATNLNIPPLSTLIANAQSDEAASAQLKSSGYSDLYSFADISTATGDISLLYGDVTTISGQIYLEVRQVKF